MKTEGLLSYQSAGAPVNGTNEQQTITPSATPASGTFKIKFDGFTTTALAWNISAANMAIALNLLPNIGTSGVDVGLSTYVYTITFSGANLAIRDQNPITVVENSVLDAGAAAVTLTVATSVAGVRATELGAAKGALLVDTTNGTLYQNTGTAVAPNWRSLILGAGAGYRIARGVYTMLSASDTLVTGLTTVVAIIASLDTNLALTCAYVSASIGDQAGAPAAGSVYIKAWMPTSVSNPTPIAATGYANQKVNWFAIGT